MIGKEQPDVARQTDLKGAIRIGLDECTTALEEALTGLTDEQAWGFPLEGRHNITTIVMHCLDNLNRHAVCIQDRESALKPDDRFDMWQHSPAELRDRQTGLPTVDCMIASVRCVREAALAALDATDPGQLTRGRDGHAWYTDWGRTAADAYMRTIMHTMAHIRQVWMLRGVMGLTDEQGWPLQHWA